MFCFIILTTNKVLEKTLESLLDCKEIQPVHSKGYQSWLFFGRNDAEAETPVLWPPNEKSWLKRLWCWEGLGAGGGGDDLGWDGWMASRTRWTWVWVNSGSWWWTGRPGVLWFMGLQSRTERLNWTELNWWLFCLNFCFFIYKMEILVMAWAISRPGLYTNLFTINIPTQFEGILDCMSFFWQKIGLPWWLRR